jgi:amino acid adenylation domain-containing protein
MSGHPLTSDPTGFRTSPQQEQLLTHAGPTVVQVAAVLPGGAASGATRAMLEQIVASQEILRTTFVQPPGMRTRNQVVHDTLALEWSERAGEVEGLAASEAERPFDLERGPLLRALLCPSDPAVLVLTAHAAIADAPSLLSIVDAIVEPVAEMPEPVQYADYAEWRHSLVAGEEPGSDDGRAFWNGALEEPPPPPRLLFGRWQASAAGSPGAIAVELGDELLNELHTAAAGAAVTAAAFLEAAWHALLARCSGASELAVVHWLDGRVQLDLLGAIGPYAQPAPLRSRLEPQTTFAELIDRVGRGILEATRWQDHASAAELALLVEAVPVGFALTEAPAPTRSATPPLPAQPLLLHCVIADEVPRLTLHYDRAVFDEPDAADLAARYLTVLARAAADPAQPIGRLAIVEPAERARLLSAAVAPAPARPIPPVHKRFEAQVGRIGAQPAVVASTGEALTYAELNARANRLAHHLRACGVERNVAVGLCMDRSPEMIVALLGILKAGGAYVPLNFEHPRARLREQLAQARASVLVTQEHLLEEVGALLETVVCPDRDADAIGVLAADDPDVVVSADDLAYVMYTSGSTGAPKGVEVTHGNLANYTAYICERLGVEDGMSFAVVSAVSTDLGNTAIYPALAGGGVLTLVDPQAAMDGDAFAAFATRHPIDVLKIAPSHLRALLAASGASEVLPRRWLLTGGELLAWELVGAIRALAPTCRLINHYGPTETTVGCTTHDVEAESRGDCASVPIGRPIDGASAFILDAEGEPVPPGVAGELVVGGAGVAAGYAGDRPETAERFVAAPDGSGRAYRTGDRVRRLRDGTIEFLGRLDDQVKVRGFRVEPGEIEAALARHPAIRQAAVAVEDAGRGESRLAAYFVSSAPPSVEELRSFLAGTLPDYMIPSTFALLDALPFTPSGKVDRQALAGLAAIDMRREASFVAPRDAVEEEIAAIWSELLGVERVGVFDDFFALGGHSLLATQAIIRIRRSHGDIPLRALLAAPTVAALANVVRGGDV